eukprot:jgi/Botrbrau1/9752/Bobra.85_1s0003.1
MGERDCPELCLAAEVACCFPQSVASTRWMIQDQMRIGNTPCDNCLIGTMIWCQYLSCICSCAACITGNDDVAEAAHLINTIAQNIWCTRCRHIIAHMISMTTREGVSHMRPYLPPDDFAEGLHVISSNIPYDYASQHKVQLDFRDQQRAQAGPRPPNVAPAVQQMARPDAALSAAPHSGPPGTVPYPVGPSPPGLYTGPQGPAYPSQMQFPAAAPAYAQGPMGAYYPPPAGVGPPGQAGPLGYPHPPGYPYGPSGYPAGPPQYPGSGGPPVPAGYPAAPPASAHKYPAL